MTEGNSKTHIDTASMRAF